MRFLLAALALLAVAPLYAQDARPTEDSVRQLLKATNASAFMDSSYKQFDDAMRASITQSLSGEPLNPTQQKIMDGMSTKLTALEAQEMSWPKLEPVMISAYRKTFTQHEVDGMLAFYRSDAGKASLEKTPAVTHEVATAMQGHFDALGPKAHQLALDTVKQLQAAGAAPAPAAQHQ
jgi:uncharacterized protein